MGLLLVQGGTITTTITEIRLDLTGTLTRIETDTLIQLADLMDDSTKGLNHGTSRSDSYAGPTHRPTSLPAGGRFRARPGDPGGPDPRPPVHPRLGDNQVVLRELPGIVNRGAPQRQRPLGRRYPLGCPVATGPPGPPLPAELLGRSAPWSGSQWGVRPGMHRTV